jgi:predicted N-acyltransferase
VAIKWGNSNNNHRLTFNAIVTTANHSNKIEWQMQKAKIRLPAVVELQLDDINEGIQLKHELRIGYSGIEKILDPSIKLYFNKSFRKALEEYCDVEWFKLAEYLAV